MHCHGALAARLADVVVFVGQYQPRFSCDAGCFQLQLWLLSAVAIMASWFMLAIT
jgi:hypothetical protein